MKIVIPNINKTQLQQTRVNINPHIESASSNTADSLLQPIKRAKEVDMLNDNLFKNRLMIIGSIINAIEIIAITPHELFIKERLDVTVLSASFIDEPTRGTKLLIANLAVFKDKLSLLCVKMFLYDNTNIKIDITNTVTEVNVFFTVFEMPEKSHVFPQARTQDKESKTLINGSIDDIKKISTREIKSIIDVAVTVALLMLPLIMSIAVIIGVNVFITPQRIFMYEVTRLASETQVLKTHNAMQQEEQIEKTEPKFDVKELAVICKMEEIIKIIKIELNDFNTLSIPASK